MSSPVQNVLPSFQDQLDIWNRFDESLSLRISNYVFIREGKKDNPDILKFTNATTLIVDPTDSDGHRRVDATSSKEYYNEIQFRKPKSGYFGNAFKMTLFNSKKEEYTIDWRTLPKYELGSTDFIHFKELGYNNSADVATQLAEAVGKGNTGDVAKLRSILSILTGIEGKASARRMEEKAIQRLGKRRVAEFSNIKEQAKNDIAIRKRARELFFETKRLERAVASIPDGRIGKLNKCRFICCGKNKTINVHLNAMKRAFKYVQWPEGTEIYMKAMEVRLVEIQNGKLMEEHEFSLVPPRASCDRMGFATFDDGDDPEDHFVNLMFDNMNNFGQMQASLIPADLTGSKNGHKVFTFQAPHMVPNVPRCEAIENYETMKKLHDIVKAGESSIYDAFYHGDDVTDKVKELISEHTYDSLKDKLAEIFPKDPLEITYNLDHPELNKFARPWKQFKKINNKRVPTFYKPSYEVTNIGIINVTYTDEVALTQPQTVTRTRKMYRQSIMFQQKKSELLEIHLTHIGNDTSIEKRNIYCTIEIPELY